MSFVKKIKLLLIVLLNILITSYSFAEDRDNLESNNGLTFSMLSDDINTSTEESYFEFIRASILIQPEFSYANSNVEEKNQSLKFAKRQRFPELSMRVINDKVIDRSVSDFNSLRKRQDDSFDAAVEISQPLYSGGSISGQIRKSITDQNNSLVERRNTISQLILDANEIYLAAVKSYTLYNKAQELVDEIDPYLKKVKERVSLGITDPIELAIFSIKYNNLKSKLQLLKTHKNRDLGIFEYFFEKKFENYTLPKVFVSKVELDKKKEAYEVKSSRLNYKSMLSDTDIIKGEYRPKFGFNSRYTVYDLDENKNDSDIRGGIYFSMPIFSFGRGAAKISASKAKANASKMSIDIEKKIDEATENQIVNLIESSLNTRNEIYSSLNDTKNQARIIKERLDSTSFLPQSYVESSLQQINLLERMLDTEISLLHGYFLYLHQNQLLNSYLRINL
jgi:outer membrane protein TolC